MELELEFHGLKIYSISYLLQANTNSSKDGNPLYIWLNYMSSSLCSEVHSADNVTVSWDKANGKSNYLFPLLSTDNLSQANPFLVWQLAAKLQIESSEELVDLRGFCFFNHSVSNSTVPLVQ